MLARASRQTLPAAHAGDKQAPGRAARPEPEAAPGQRRKARPPAAFQAIAAHCHAVDRINSLIFEDIVADLAWLAILQPAVGQACSSSDASPKTQGASCCRMPVHLANDSQPLRRVVHVLHAQRRGGQTRDWHSSRHSRRRAPTLPSLPSSRKKKFSGSG